ncbi:MAG: TldD/PmbA family protein [Bacteroidales bacterium]|nr:TldD/PmbA family protein [Bacteroidales bacterium]
METKEMELARWARDYALKSGAKAVRARLMGHHEVNLELRNGEISRSGSEDCTLLGLTLYRDDRCILLQTDKLSSKEELARLIVRALETGAYLEADPDASLPPLQRKYTGEKSDDDACDPSALAFDANHLLDLARRECRYEALCQKAEGRKAQLISEVLNVSRSLTESFLCDSDAFEGSRSVSSWHIDSEIHLRDEGGRIHSQFDWESSPFLDRLQKGVCSENAFRKCLERMGEQACGSFTGTMVVAAEKASKFVNPLISALRAEYVRRDQSFLKGKTGEKVFADCLTVKDNPFRQGHPSSRDFDSEGVATSELVLIDRGVVRAFYANTLHSRKSGLPQTFGEPCSNCIEPFCKGLEQNKKSVNLQDILSLVKDGIYVTDFNGGNCNPLSGDFSFGVEGFRIQDGKTAGPVCGMVVTGNLVSLFQGLVAAGSDAPEKMNDKVGTLAFEKVNFNG